MGLFDKWTTPKPGTQPSKGIVGYLRSMLGGYPGNQQAVKSPEFVAELRDEGVASGPRGIVLPWFPPYTAYTEGQSESSPEMQQAYRKMFADPNVKSAVVTQVFGVSQLDLKIDPPKRPDARDQEIAAFCCYVFTDCISKVDLAWNVLIHGMIDGYSVNKKLYEPETEGEWAGKIVLYGTKPLDVGFDIVLQVDEFRNIVALQGLRYNAGEYYDPSLFIISQHMPMYNSPAGQSALRAAYRAWWMLKVIEQLRGWFLEKRAIPLMAGYYTTPSQKQSVDRALGLAKSRTWVSLPEGTRVEAINAAGSASDVYESAKRDYKHDIFLGIQAASLPNLEGTVSDGRGNTEVQQSNADLFKGYLSAKLCDVLNNRKTGLIRDVTNLNYVTARYPKATLSSVDDAAVDTKLKNYFIGWEMGLDLSKEEIREVCNWKAPVDNNDCLSGKPPQAMGPGSKTGQPPGPGGPTAMSDPAQEVPGTTAFRFSEQWGNYLKRAGS
jgi:hypothetical protein